MNQLLFGDGQADRLAKLMDVSQLRARVHAANIANQNTPGYKTKAVAFEDSFREALTSGASLDEVEPEIYEPLTSAAQPDGNDVSVDRQVMEQAQNNTLYNTYLALATGKKKLLTIAMSTAPGG
jgi:flagellar basal-body rod protein FlgB